MFFFFMFVLLFVYATIAHYPGTHLWGYVGLLWAATLQIIAGMFFACFDPPHHAHHIWIKQMKRMTSRLIRIFFAGTAAFPIPVTKLLSLEAFWKGSILGIFACVTTKVFCAPFIGKARSVIGWATTAKEANMATSQAAFVDEKVDGIAGACGAGAPEGEQPSLPDQTLVAQPCRPCGKPCEDLRSYLLGGQLLCVTGSML